MVAIEEENGKTWFIKKDGGLTLKEEITGKHLFILSDEDLPHLLAMINSAQLPERRVFNGLKKHLENKLKTK